MKGVHGVGKGEGEGRGRRWAGGGSCVCVCVCVCVRVCVSVWECWGGEEGLMSSKRESSPHHTHTHTHHPLPSPRLATRTHLRGPNLCARGCVCIATPRERSLEGAIVVSPSRHPSRICIVENKKCCSKLQTPLDPMTYVPCCWPLVDIAGAA